MSILIKNGNVVTLEGISRADLRVNEGVIQEMASQLFQNYDDVVIDADGLQIFPGGIDLHTHFDHVGVSDDFASGTRAAAAGGITTVSCFVEGSMQLNLIDNFKDWKYRRAKTSYVDYKLVPVLSGLYAEEFKTQLSDLVAEGVNAVKLFMAYSKAGLLTKDADLYCVMRDAAKSNILCNVHCENGDVIDEIVKEWVKEGKTEVVNHGYTRTTGMEAEAVYRAIRIAEAAHAPLRIVHVSSQEAAEIIAAEKKKGRTVLAETCPHYLVKDIGALALPNFDGAKNVCSPPLREKYHLEALWKAIRDGVITTVSSDHAPVNFYGQYSKQLGKEVWSDIPNGCPGVEELYSIIYHFGVAEKRISIEKFIEITSVNPAKEFGLYPKKGCIGVGSDADLVLMDPSASRVISHENQYGKTDYNSYEGYKITGVISYVLSRGEIIVKDGKVLAAEGRGKYLPSKTSCAF